MKELGQKIKESKGTVWVLALLVCAAFFLLLPGSSGGDSAMTAEEKRLSETLSAIAGAGRTRISIYYSVSGSGLSGETRVPCGAVIVSEGADDIAVKLNLLRAAQTLLQLPAGAVEVFDAEGSP